MLNRIQDIGRWLKTSGLFLWKRPAWRSGDRNGQEEVALGWAGEKVAAKYLRKLGYRIIAHGHRQRLGEIDLIALDGDCLVFVEVKTWRSDAHADPSEAVDRRKQERITRAALIYLKKKRLLEHPARFDVISIVWPDTRSDPKIRHFQSAFEAVGSGQLFR